MLTERNRASRGDCDGGRLKKLLEIDEEVVEADGNTLARPFLFREMVS